MMVGHYAQIGRHSDGIYTLKQSTDTIKDQTYFLSGINGHVLEKTLFPIGHLLKSQVKAIASCHGFDKQASQPESMGICFIGKRPFGSFLQEYIDKTPGDIVSLDGTVIGTHDGLGFYTVGQRLPFEIRVKGSPPTAWYISSKNQVSNQLIAVNSSSHPSLYTSSITLFETSWIQSPPKIGMSLLAKIRSTGTLIPAYLNGNQLYFLTSQYGLSPGQHVALYHHEICLGGGKISHIL